MFIAAALIGSIVAFGDNYAYAGRKKNHNDSEQENEQENEQNTQCVSEEFTLLCGNNLNLQLQEQLGNLALGQQ